MMLFLTAKKREQICDQIDSLMMKQYYCRCKIEEAEKASDDNLIQHEKDKIAELDKQLEKLRKKIS